MTDLLLTMLRTRMSLALTTFALTALAVAAAVTGPIYAAAAARSTIAVEVASAPVAERIITADRLDDPRSQDAAEPLPRQPFIPGFETLAATMSHGQFRTADGSTSTWLVARSRQCRHVVLAAGRCPNADREVMVRQDIANELGVTLGARATFLGFSFGGGRPTGSLPVTVVGVYQPYLATDPHWADRIMLNGVEEAPVFTTERTVRAVTGAPILVATDLIASPEAFSDRARLGERVREAVALLEAARYQPGTEIDALSARIDAAERTLSASFVLATLPLVVICWYVLLLALIGAVEQRRGELAVTGLHGVPTRTRWFLAMGETLVPMVAGCAPGLLLGYAAAAALALNMLPGRPEVAFSPLAAALAAVAVLGAATVGTAAQWRAIRQPVLRLLRGIRRRRSGAAVRIAEAVVGVLALATGYQATTAAGLGGIALLAPVCFGLVCGLLAGRLLLAPAERLGRRLLRRGWLGPGLAALALSRRPGSRAIVALLTVGFGILGFALIAADTAEQAWRERADLETGAVRVLAVSPLPASRLLDAVRKVDQDGSFAMAVAQVQQSDGPPVLAVDATRLPAVAHWPSGGQVTAAQASALLRPVTPTPLLLDGGLWRIAVTLHELGEATVARLELSVVKPDGTRATIISDPLRPGTALYTMDSPACAAGPCRLVSLGLNLATYGPQRVNATIGAITGSQGRPILSLATLTEPGRWRQPEATQARPVGLLRTTPQGLNLSTDSPLPVNLRLRPAAAPEPLPVLGTGQVPTRFAAIGASVAATPAGTLPLLPRLSGNGALVDLEYLDLAINPRAEALTTQVWLGPRAPANAVELLREAGLSVEREISSGEQHELFRHQAPALALRFQRLAAFAAMLLAAAGLLVGAVLQRARREEDLSILVPHGLSARSVHIGAVASRWVLAAVAVTVGLAAAIATWVVARPTIPVFASTATPVPPPFWPDPRIGGVLLGALAFLLGTGWIAAHMAKSAAEGTAQ